MVMQCGQEVRNFFPLYFLKSSTLEMKQDVDKRIEACDIIIEFDVNSISVD